MRVFILFALAALASTTSAFAAAPDVTQLPTGLALPFAGLLASIAIFPLIAARFWHAHYGKAASVWALVSLVFLGLVVGPGPMSELVFHTLALEYVPFIVMLFALFTAAGGIVVQGDLRGTPLTNTGLLALGTALASVIGTTGAAMILIRPILRANANRPTNAHVVIFFIFLVANIGGALSPLGDPPLFLGFLRGVDFFWPLQALWRPTLLASVCLLVLFFALDAYLSRGPAMPETPLQQTEAVSVRGLINLALILVAIIAIVMSGIWKPQVAWVVLGTKLELQNLVREAVLLLVGLSSLALTPAGLRARNGFTWEPILEVAKIFAAIFVCIVPVIVMLNTGAQGPFAPLLALVQQADGSPWNAAYFWMTGLLSSVLDNAPTYLVFFELAGGDPARLMGSLAHTLAAISMGAVFMGAGTYIGNAPNFMVYAIARQAGVRMPGFFGYMLWSGGILGPLFGLITYIFLRN